MSGCPSCSSYVVDTRMVAADWRLSQVRNVKGVLNWCLVERASLLFESATAVPLPRSPSARTSAGLALAAEVKALAGPHGQDTDHSHPPFQCVQLPRSPPMVNSLAAGPGNWHGMDRQARRRGPWPQLVLAPWHLEAPFDTSDMRLLPPEGGASIGRLRCPALSEQRTLGISIRGRPACKPHLLRSTSTRRHLSCAEPLDSGGLQPLRRLSPCGFLILPKSGFEVSCWGESQQGRQG